MGGLFMKTNLSFNMQKNYKMLVVNNKGFKNARNYIHRI